MPESPIGNGRGGKRIAAPQNNRGQSFGLQNPYQTNGAKQNAASAIQMTLVDPSDRRPAQRPMASAATNRESLEFGGDGASASAASTACHPEVCARGLFVAAIEAKLNRQPQ